MRRNISPERQQLLLQAIHELESALALLDRAAAPAHVGAHVDLAIHQLQESIEGDFGGGPSQIDRNAEPQ